MPISKTDALESLRQTMATKVDIPDLGQTDTGRLVVDVNPPPRDPTEDEIQEGLQRLKDLGIPTGPTPPERASVEIPYDDLIDKGYAAQVREALDKVLPKPQVLPQFTEFPQVPRFVESAVIPQTQVTTGQAPTPEQFLPQVRDYLTRVHWDRMFRLKQAASNLPSINHYPEGAWNRIVSNARDLIKDDMWALAVLTFACSMTRTWGVNSLAYYLADRSLNQAIADECVACQDI